MKGCSTRSGLLLLLLLLALLCVLLCELATAKETGGNNTTNNNSSSSSSSSSSSNGAANPQDVGSYSIRDLFNGGVPEASLDKERTTKQGKSCKRSHRGLQRGQQQQQQQQQDSQKLQEEEKQVQQQLLLLQQLQQQLQQKLQQQHQPSTEASVQQLLQLQDADAAEATASQSGGSAGAAAAAEPPAAGASGGTSKAAAAAAAAKAVESGGLRGKGETASGDGKGAAAESKAAAAAAAGAAAAAAAAGLVPKPGLLRRTAYRIKNSRLFEELISLLHYFAGPFSGRPTKVLLQQSDAVGVGLGLLLLSMRVKTPAGRLLLSKHVLSNADVKEFIGRFAYLADPCRSTDDLLQQLQQLRSAAARLALGGYGARQTSEFLELLSFFRKEYFRVLGFAALCLKHLPSSLPALSLFVSRLLIPLQDAFRSIASVSARFKGFSAALAQQQLLSWVRYLAGLDAALLQLLPGGNQTLSRMHAASSFDASFEETDSSYGSQEGDFVRPALSSHL